MTPTPTLYGSGHERREASPQAPRALVGGALCLDFMNTVAAHDGSPGVDELAPGYVNVAAWFMRAGAIDDAESTRLLRLAHREPRDAAAARRRAVDLREALYEVTLALATGGEPNPASLAAFNNAWQESRRHGAFVAGDRGLAWRWQDAADLDRPLWLACQSAADLLGGDSVGRIRQCAAPACQRLFLDTTKNGSRQFCSAATCGGAERVRRFRERHRASAGTPYTRDDS